MNGKTTGIVVGYDGSPDADGAVRWAAESARLRGEPLTLTIVAERMESPRSPGWPESWWEDIEESGRKTLAAAGFDGAEIRRHVGGLVPGLLDAAYGASMLVLGSRGHSRIGELLLGSVSQSAARRAECPVVVVREAQAADPSRIVVGVDGSESSLRALAFAGEQAGFSGQEVIPVRAWKPLTLPVDEHGHLPASTAATLLEEEQALDETVAEGRARFPGVSITGEFIATAPGQALVDASSTAALVVVGRRGRSALTETVLGSVSHHVLHRARCPVAVVR